MDLVKVEYQMPDLPVVGSAVQFANAITIDSQETYDFANDQLGVVKARWKELDAARKTIVDPINAAKTAVQNIFNPVLADLADAESVYKRSMLKYQREQDDRRKEEQAKLDEAARLEREKLEKAAEKAGAKGHAEKAAVLAATAAVISAPIATSTYVSGKGLSTKKVWKARVVDKKQALIALTSSPTLLAMFLNTVEFDLGVLNRLAASMEGQIPIAGIETYQDETLARRAA